MNYLVIPGLKHKSRLRVINPTIVRQAVCKYFGCTESQLTRVCRKRLYVDRRRIYMYLLRNMTNLSLSEIAVACGKHDHANVIHSVNKCRDLMQTELEFRRAVETIRESIY